MPGSLRNAVLGAVAATVIAGCGSDDGTIPQQEADNLLNRLEAIDENVGEGHCDDAVVQAEAFASDVDDLSREVEDEVRRGLQESARNLVTLATSDCEPEDLASGPAGAVTTDTEPPPETTTTTEPTTTTEEADPAEEEDAPVEPAEPQADEPQPDEDVTPPSGNQGPGGGNVGSDGGVSPSGGVSGGGGSSGRGGGE